MRTRDLMTSEVATCRSNETESRAAQLMWERDCGTIPVVDESNHVVGMITDRDLCMGAYTSGRPLAELPVTNSMSRDVVSCRATDTVEAALATMGEHRLHRRRSSMTRATW